MGVFFYLRPLSQEQKQALNKGFLYSVSGFGVLTAVLEYSCIVLTNSVRRLSYVTLLCALFAVLLTTRL